MKKTPFIIQAMRENIRKSFEVQERSTKTLNHFIKGNDVVLKCGKYKDRVAQVQEYYHDCGNEYLRVFIYRVDGRSGFKGREQFIDDHIHEFVRFEDCEFA